MGAFFQVLLVDFRDAPVFQICDVPHDPDLGGGESHRFKPGIHPLAVGPADHSHPQPRGHVTRHFVTFFLVDR